MAEINILKASIQGTVGAHTGVRVKGKNIMKAKIWSKTPPNQTQTDCVRSFECLNRFSSAIAKKYWYWLPYKQGNRHKHNVIASEFKTLIRGHFFSPVALKEIIPVGARLDVSACDMIAETSTLHIEVTNSLPEMSAKTQNALLIVCDSHGIVYYCETLAEGLTAADLKIPWRTNYPFYFIAFSSTKDAKGKITLGDLQMKLQFPTDVFYTENHPKIKWWTINPYYLYGEGEGISTDGTALVVDDTIG